MAKLNYRDPGTNQFVEVTVGGEVPVGLVVAFAGTAAPAGWHLCDGTPHGSAELQAILGSANTPNLADRFVVGVGATHAAKATGGVAAVAKLTGAQSGTTAHTHTVTSGNQSVPHSHANSTTTSMGGHSHAGGYRATTIRNTDMSQTTGTHNVLSHTSTAQSVWPDKSHTHPTATTVSGGAHTHRVDVTASTAADATATHENLPPFYALAFIICTG